MPNPKAFVPRQDRFAFNDDSDVNVIIRRQSSSEMGEKLDAKPLDISRHGIKISTSRPLEFGESVELTLQSRELDVEFEVAVEVRWIRQGVDEQTWIVGCSHSSELADDCLDALGAAGHFNRRLFPRRELKMQATVQCAGSPSEIAVGLLNYSAEGLLFSTSEPLKRYQLMKLLLNDGLGNSFELKVISQWQRSFESGYLVGCEIKSGKSRGLFNDWRDGIAPKAPRQSRPRTRTLLTACGVILIALLLGSIWLT